MKKKESIMLAKIYWFFFYINFSDFLCTLYKTPYMVTIRDSFYVLSDNHHIKSHLNLENCLLFTQRDQINMCVCVYEISCLFVNFCDCDDFKIKTFI